MCTTACCRHGKVVHALACYRFFGIRHMHRAVSLPIVVDLCTQPSLLRPLSSRARDALLETVADGKVLTMLIWLSFKHCQACQRAASSGLRVS